MEFTEENFTTEETMKTQKKKEFEPLICPECAENGITVTFANERVRGVHRRFKHNVPGTSSVAYREQERAAKLAKKRIQHAALVPAEQPTRVFVQPQKAEISVAMLGYAMGRLESLAEQIARENNLPEKEFVKQVAANLAKLVER